jgi:hypothetical protein
MGKNHMVAGLSAAILITMLPGAALAAWGDWIQGGFVEMAINSRSGVLPPSWATVPLTGCYLAGIVLGFTLSMAHDLLFPLKRHHHNEDAGNRPARNRRWAGAVAFAVVFGAAWFGLQYSMGLGGDVAFVGMFPAAAARWWLRRHGVGAGAEAERNPMAPPAPERQGEA